MMYYFCNSDDPDAWAIAERLKDTDAEVHLEPGFACPVLWVGDRCLCGACEINAYLDGALQRA